MNSFNRSRRVWFDTNIGANPSTAIALIFAIARSDLEVVGLSISGKNQEQRKAEAVEVLNILDRSDIPVFLGVEIKGEQITELTLDSTITTGPLTNISRLVLEEADLGHIHIMGGNFQGVYSYGDLAYKEANINADLDSARIVLSQYEGITLSVLEASSQLILDNQFKSEIENKYPFMSSRFKGYDSYLENKFGEDFVQLHLSDCLAVCDVVDTPTISREIVEFVFQANGTFLSTTPLSSCPNPIEPDLESKKSDPSPTVKCEVIRTANTARIIQEIRDSIL